MKTIAEKSKSFYCDFVRKGTADTKTTHYCPGCGHGNIHKYVAEALDIMGLQDKTVMISPVGCSVFVYYYFDTGNVQVPHGRAPAVGTALKRSNPDSIVISYQGDGDLAAIGGNEILQAANRGENMTVIFVNNNIYGMTGGQMAPTTLIGQKTATTPYGRTFENEGPPMKMSELIAGLDAPVYVERVKVTDAKSRNRTRMAIKKAIKAQVENKGFSFIEILSPCPTGWKKTPVDSCKWIDEEVSKYFPVQVFKDELESRASYKPEPANNTLETMIKALKLEAGEDEKHEIDPNFKNQNIRIAGFGGQGVLTAGVTLSVLGMELGLQTTWIPSYGPEMRGGTCNCHVKISKEKPGSPLVTNPNCLIAMNGPSLDSFEDLVIKGGTIFVNSSIVDQKVKRTDVDVVYVPVTDIANEVGLIKTANIVALAALLEHTKIMPVQKLKDVIKKSLKKKDLVDINIKAVDAGVNYIKNNANK